MPKVVDYSGRFAFFELAAFTLLRDHGVSSLSRHGVARILATSISTVRRLLSPEADLRTLALNEVGVRRRRRLRGRGSGTGVDAALRHLAAVVPFEDRHVVEELVWWRLAVAAPSTACPPADTDHTDDEEEGQLHHRFAVASHGYVPIDVLEAAPQRATCGFVPDGHPDVVVSARHERDADVSARALDALVVAAPDLSAEEAGRLAPVLHAVIDGLGVAVAVGRLTPADAREVARTHLDGLSRTAR